MTSAETATRVTAETDIRRNSFSIAPVKVLVGAEETCFYVHPQIIRRSEFLKTALKPEWSSKQIDAIKLEQELAADFNAYLEWSYAITIQIAPPSRLALINITPDWLHLTRLYVLGERFMDHDFQDRVIDAMVSYTCNSEEANRHPSQETINYVYANTSTDSPLRRLIVDLHVRYGDNGQISHSTENSVGIDHTFLIDFCQAASKMWVLPHRHQKEYSHLEDGSPCKYHKHANERPCGGKTAQDTGEEK